MRYIPKSSEVLQALQDSIGKQIAEREEQKKNYVPTPVEIKPEKRYKHRAHGRRYSFNGGI